MRQKFIIYAHQPIVRIMCMVMFGALTVPGATWAQTLAAGSIESLQRLSIEELANLQVTSVPKIPESLHEAPAAVYVITHDGIIRSGARRIPDMLRLAPNLELFQTSLDNYVITARGLSGSSSAQTVPNKIEVPIDGRSVNSLLYSGVYLDMQNVLPENIDRNPDFQPEKLTAFEVGDRAEFGNASVSVSGFPVYGPQEHRIFPKRYAAAAVGKRDGRARLWRGVVGWLSAAAVVAAGCRTDAAARASGICPWGKRTAWRGAGGR